MVQAGDLIISEECQKFGIDKSELLSDSRLKHIVELRHIIAYRLRAELNWSLPRIGLKLHRDHCSIRNLLKRPPPKSESSDIKPGHNVRHITGGPKMAVNSIDANGMASCILFKDGKFETNRFHVKTILRVEDD